MKLKDLYKNFKPLAVVNDNSNKIGQWIDRAAQNKIVKYPGAVGNFVTQNTQRFGRSLGQSLYAPTYAKQQAESQKKTMDLDNRIMQAALKQSDPAKRRQLLQIAQQKNNSYDINRDLDVMNKTPLQIAAEAGGMATEALAAGNLTGVKMPGVVVSQMASPMKRYMGYNTLRGLEGGAYNTLSAAADGKRGKDLVKSFGTGFGTGFVSNAVLSPKLGKAAFKYQGIVNKMDAPIPTRYSKVIQDGIETGNLYKPKVKTVQVSTADFEKEITGVGAKVNRPEERGVVTKIIDPKTNKLISWSTDNPNFAKRTQEGQLAFGLSTRKIRPSENPLSNEAKLTIPANGKPKFNLSDLTDTSSLPELNNMKVRFSPRRGEILRGANGGVIGNDIIIADDLIEKIPSKAEFNKLQSQIDKLVAKETAGTLTKEEYNQAAKLLEQQGKLKDVAGAEIKLTDDAKKTLAHEVEHIRERITGKVGNTTPDNMANLAKGAGGNSYIESPSEIAARNAGERAISQSLSTTPKTTAIDPEIKRVGANILKNNPGITQRDAEAMAKDVIEGRKFSTTPVTTAQAGKKVRLPNSGLGVQNNSTLGKTQISGTLAPTSNKVSRPSSSLPETISQKPSSIKGKLTKEQIENTRAEVAANLQKKYDDLEMGLYGSATSELQGGTKGAGLISRVTRPIQEKTSAIVGQGLESQNPVYRGIARGIRGLFGGSGNTQEITNRVGQYKGGVQTAENLSNDFMKLGDDLLPDKGSRERVWAVLDPELAGKKILEKNLNAQERKALAVLRQASDLINDTNFSMGRISHDVWNKGKGGNYWTRAYEDIDLPPELSKAFSGSRGKLDLGGYKQRGEVTDWKMDNAIKDPFYLASKRIQSTFQNKAITDYSSWISKQSNLVSDVEKAGYSQVSDSPMWGDLSGKWVRKDIMEGIRGYYFDSKALQGAYDALVAYDRNPVRQILKRTKTVYNPATRLGNQFSNRVFAIFNGINPISFEKNMQTFSKRELKNNGMYARFLRENGVLGNDMTKYDLVQKLADDGVDPGVLTKINRFVSESYGAADEQAKLSAFKYWLDKGKTKEEALEKVRRGFQDYSKVGLYYDVMSRFPLIGKPFVRFQSELIRIIKNGALENPLGVATVMGSIKLMGDATSKWSGESPEDKKTREERFGTPVVPFTDIPLVMQTPYGEVNIARMFGMYETNIADTENKNFVQRVSKYLPTDIPTGKEDTLRMMGNDVFAGGVMNLITDTDFRGKSIADPAQSKYKPSTLTKEEKLINQAKYLGYNYNLPVINDSINVGQAYQGKPDQYGNTKTPKQAISKLVGIKINQFGHEEAVKERAKQTEYDQYKKDDQSKLVGQINKQLLKGEITQEQADKRIKAITGNQTAQKQGDARMKLNPINNKWQVIDQNGDSQSYDTQIKARKALDKMDFDQSGKSYEVKGDTVFYRDKNGEPQEKPLSEVQDKHYELDYTLRLERAKRGDDYKSWNKLQTDYLGKLETEYKSLDPNNPIDVLRRYEIMNKIGDIQTEMAKFAKYGGFKKPKAVKAPRVETGTIESSPKFSLPGGARTVNKPRLVVKRPRTSGAQLREMR